jgi:hypothetical protein
MTIEDYIEILSTLDVDTRDRKLITSLSSQIKKNIGLTDRQHSLAKKKVKEYEKEFSKNGYDINDGLDNLRHPYREIDRSKKVFLVEKESFTLFDNEKKVMIGITFPYSNKMIKHINFIKSLQDRNDYDSKSKTHFLKLNEKNVFEIVDRLKECNFEIDEELLNFYNIIQKFIESKNDFIPGIVNYKFVNTSKIAEEYAIKILGVPTVKNLALYYDRKDILGLNLFDSNELNRSFSMLTPLAEKIAKLENKNIFMSKIIHTFFDVCNVINELKRFPLLVILSKGQENQDLVDLIDSLQKFIDIKDISVLFRLDNISGNNIDFNENVKKFKLNNKITEATQVIIINNEKLPKPLLISKWQPTTTLLLASIRHSRLVSTYYNKCELVIHFDTQPTTWIHQKTTEI